MGGKTKALEAPSKLRREDKKEDGLVVSTNGKAKAKGNP